jgi:hypothetical protein
MDALPTDKQREMLGELIQDAFVEIRFLGWNGKAEQAADLADAFHNISREMYGWGSFSWEVFRAVLKNYRSKWRNGDGVGTFDYAERLDEIRHACDSPSARGRTEHAPKWISTDDVR